MTDTRTDPAHHYRIVARAVDYIRSTARPQPALADIAAAVQLSEYHLQRVFSEWAGISPKRFLQFLTKEHAKQSLRQSADVLTAALQAGLSGSGRLHDLLVSCEAMTPGEIKARGRGVTLRYGTAPTPFGEALIGWTPRGVCHLAFPGLDHGQALKELAAQWPDAALIRDEGRTGALAERIFSRRTQPGKLHLLLRGSNFQIKVWEALLNTHPAQLLSYSQLARLSGCPNAPRTVASALAGNTIGYLIPCHRVIREGGDVGRYRWGSARKMAMQAWEAGIMAPPGPE